MDEIEEMERELADRFGPLPEPTQNLMYQLRLKALARDAGVKAVAIDNGRLALRSGRGEYRRERLRPALGRRVSIGRRGVWLPMEDGWREELVDVLREIARVRA
jgi:transcription-repair coupling factor (superfamily II helicase)